MAQEQTTNIEQQQAAMQEMLAMAQREQQGERVSVEELQAFVTKNKDVLPPEMTAQMQEQLDAVKTMQTQAPAPDAAPKMKNFDDSFAMERTALERDIAEKSAQREMKATEREAIKGTNTIQSAAIGGVSAAAAMKVMHGMYNDQSILNKMLKEATKKGFTEEGTFSEKKVQEIVENFGKNIFTKVKDGDLTQSQLDNNKIVNDASKKLGDFVKQAQQFTKDGMANEFNSKLNDLDDSVVKTLSENVKDFTAAIVKEADKLAQIDDPAKATDTYKSAGELIDKKLKPLLDEGKLDKDQIQAIKDKATNFIENNRDNKKQFLSKEKGDLLKPVEELASKVATEGRKFGEQMQKPVEAFNSLNKNNDFKGRAAQFGVVAAVVVGTAALIAGVDHLLKSGGDKKKQQLTTDIRNFDEEIANDKVKLTSFVDRYAADAAKAEQQTSFAEKVSKPDGANNIVKTDGSFGDKVRAEQEDAKTAELSV